MTRLGVTFFVLFSFAFSVLGSNSFYSNLDSAKVTAKSSNKNILVVFAGSDWCRPCIQFKRDILLNEAFITYANEHLVIVYLDFPSHKKNQLPPAQTAYNEKLAEQYNANGVFPKTILFDASEKKLSDLAFKGQTPVDFINTCKAFEPIEDTKKVLTLMGCRFEITTVESSDTLAWNALHAGIKEISRIESLISSWDSNSKTSLINIKAGIQPVKVPMGLHQLIVRSNKVSRLTDGSFDISFASMSHQWTFDQQEQTLPDSSAVLQSIAKIA
ncbi:MAG: thioredoxin-related protein [Bacteroidia bacterium]|jgi:thioredoxin-related protein